MSERLVTFGEREIGPDRPVFITFEAGPTHNGLESAKRLIRHAADAGADAVKFQMLHPDRLMGDRDVAFSYDVLLDAEEGTTERVEEPLYDLMKRRALSKHEWRELKEYSNSCGLAFFATAGFPEEVDFLVEMGCDSIKIASADVNYVQLIRHAARTGVCLQLDTGNASIGEIEAAIDLISAEGNDNVIIHHCPSGYPARIDGINLNVIPTLVKMFPFPIAFSDHSPGWEMDVAAVALGASVVEKTITEDRLARSIEHIMSIEPSDMRGFVETVHNVQRALGAPRRILHDTERKNRLNARRSTYLINNEKAGTRLGDLQVEFRRPGFGIGPDRFEELRSAKLGIDLPANHRLELVDLVYD